MLVMVARAASGPIVTTQKLSDPGEKPTRRGAGVTHQDCAGASHHTAANLGPSLPHTDAVGIGTRRGRTLPGCSPGNRHWPAACRP